MTDILQDILSRLQAVHETRKGRQWTARCPCHEDEHPSLSIGVGTKGEVLVKCWAGCATKSVLHAIGLTMPDLFPDGSNSKRASRSSHGEGRRPRVHPSVEEAAESFARFRGGSVEYIYTWTDSWSRARIRLPADKTFCEITRNGNGWVLEGPPKPHVLYHADRLPTANLVVVAEGERCVEAIESIGFVATTSGGSTSASGACWSALQGKRVAILPDHDVPGRRYAHAVQGQVPQAVIVELPGLTDGEDVVQWLERRECQEPATLHAALMHLIEAAEQQMTETSTSAPEDDTAEFPLTDLGNAERLVHEHGEDLQYTDSHGWLVRTGTHWERDTMDVVVRLAAATVRKMYKSAGQIEDLEKRKRLAAWAVACESRKRLADMVVLARSQAAVRISVDALDADPWLLNVENGTLDLRNGELCLHRRKDLVTRCCPVRYDQSATAPRWEAFLDRIMDGDTNLIGFLQRAAGYSLTGDVSERQLFVLHGTGKNGKSTFLNALRELLGEYAQQTPTRTLMAKDSEGIPNDIARLKGSRFVTAIETSEGQRLDVERIKQMTGGTDVLVGRFLRAEYFEFPPQFKLWLACNHKPAVRDTTNSIWDRIGLVPFQVRIPTDEVDPHLDQRLRTERAGILNWALAGLQAWRTAGLRAPDRVRTATADYRHENDIFGQWLDEECVTGNGGSDTLKHLFENYMAWCNDNGIHHTMTRNRFGRSLTERGFVPGHSGGRIYSGLQLRTSSKVV